jgi:integrase
MSEGKQEKKSPWAKTPVANLVRYRSSGVYFARVRVAGKLIRQSLKTNVFSVAKIRLADLTQEQRKAAEVGKLSANGKMSFGDARGIYEERLKNNQRLKPTAKQYRIRTIKDLGRTWSGLNATDIRKISERECLEWAAKYAEKYSPTVYNNTVGTLRHILEIGIRAGARYGNPANAIPKLKVRQKVLKLPEQKQFLHMVEAIGSAGGRFSKSCADLTEFLAYSGCRKGEAARVHGRDCDFKKGEIAVHGDPATGTKNWEIRRVPMIPDMRRLLERIRSGREEEEWMNTTVMGVRECQKALDSACKKLGVSRITHHDLRHLFATRCIESGVDIPTVSRWLGHKDGGALAMKTYGHLRDQHSAAMAQKVTFADSPSSQS